MIRCRSQSWIKAAILKALRSIICRYSTYSLFICKPNKSKKALGSSLASPMLRWNFPKNGRVSLNHPWCWLLDLLQALWLAPALNVMRGSILRKWRLQGLTCSQLLRCSFPASAHWRDRSFKSESGSRFCSIRFAAEKKHKRCQRTHWGSGSGGRICWWVHGSHGIGLLQPWFCRMLLMVWTTFGESGP